MNISSSMKYAAVVSVLIASLTGCGTGNSTMPLASAASSASETAVGTPAQLAARGAVSYAAPIMRSNRSGSWILPEAQTKPTLLYVSDGDVNVYSYPDGKLEGKLTGFDAPAGMCTGKAGEVYIINGNGTTVEVYAHGGSKPIRVLGLPGYPGFGCSVDPRTGAVAIGGSLGTCTECGGSVAVFPKGSTVPTKYALSITYFVFGCTYDNQSNLYCATHSHTNSIATNNKFQLIELPKGGSQFNVVNITAPDITSFGDIKWDGKNLALSNLGTTIYQIQVSGSAASVVGTTQLTTPLSGWAWDFTLVPSLKSGADATALVPFTAANRSILGYWNYPAGGRPFRKIRGSSGFGGATISQI